MSEPRKCDSCKVNRATVHLTQIIKSAFKKTHLCQQCSEEQGPITPELLQSMAPASQTPVSAAASLPAMLAAQLKSASESTTPSLTCETCGLTFEEFKRHGRLGCSDDYEVFGNSLEPILLKIHKSAKHIGRVPPDTDGDTAGAVRVRTLKARLDEAVKGERFEDAAKLRDEIQQLAQEATGGPDGAR